MTDQFAVAIIQVTGGIDMVCLFFGQLIVASLLAAEPSFDCRTKQAHDEKLICTNPMLAALDNKMAAAYKAAQLKESGRYKNVLKEKQRAWLQVRKLCAEVPVIEHANRCLLALYEEHVDELLETGGLKHIMAPTQSQPTAQGEGK